LITRPATRLTPATRFGDCRVANANPALPVDKVCLHEKDGLLYCSYRMPKLSPYPISVAITPVSATEAVIAGIGRARGGTLQVVDVAGRCVCATQGARQS